MGSFYGIHAYHISYQVKLIRNISAAVCKSRHSRKHRYLKTDLRGNIWLTAYCIWLLRSLISKIQLWSYSTNDFSILIQIQWKFCFSVTVTPLSTAISLPKFHSCHDCTAVVPWARFHSDHLTTIWRRAESNFHRIWFTIEKLFMEWVPGWINNVRSQHPLPVAGHRLPYSAVIVVLNVIQHTHLV